MNDKPNCAAKHRIGIITMRRKQKSMKTHATIWEVQIVRAFITRILNNDARKNHVTGKWGNKYNGDKHSANTL